MVQRRAAWWVTNRYSSYDSVSAMLGNLGWRSLENRHYDARLTMFYKIQHGLVAVPMPSYFERPKITHHSLNNPLSFRQVYASADYCRFSFFPMTVVLWNRLSADIVFLSDLDSFKRGEQDQSLKAIESNIIFNLLLNLIHTNTQTLSSFFSLHYHSFSPHYNFFTFYSHTRIPAHNTQ